MRATEVLSVGGSAAALFLGLACGTSEPSVDPFASSATATATDGPTAPPTSSPTGTSAGGSTGAEGSGSETAAADSTGSGIKLDVGAAATDETGEADFCNYVDVLFVIDNSLSMNSYQNQLALAWPTFVDAMWKNLPPGTDLHVGLTTTSFYTGSCSEGIVNCVTTASDDTINDHYVTPDAGNTGTNGEQGRLFEWAGQNYFEATVGEDSGDLKLWFSQAAVAAGETGCSFEMMSAAAGYAVHPANDTANAGFLRDEGAVLLVVVLSDEPDKSPEGAQTYYDMLVDAKAGCGGDACIVTTGLVDPCIQGVDNQLWQFFNLFGNYIPYGDLDNPVAYTDVVGAALAEVIGETCDQIPPAG